MSVPDAELMSENPYKSVLDHRGDSNKIITGMSDHSRLNVPDSPLKWAWWWFTTATLHAAAASHRNGDGSASAADCFRRAAGYFEQTGDFDRAELCRSLQASRLRIAARVAGGGDNA